ncbi:MAG TPA: tetratricopeptide repeat protein [Gemmataceae bacterium]
MTSEKPSPTPGPSETPPNAEAGSSPTLPTGECPSPIETTPPLTAGAAVTVAASARRIGRYQVFDEVGHGGMGNVFRGRDPELGRELAIKVLRAEHQLRPDLVRRFIEEARVGGGLQHPGVVPVYELGRAAAEDVETSRPYFTMKLIEGRTLAALLAERRDPAQDLPRFLKVFEQICQTLAYAHARGVIHRDLKPANIMVGAFGEVQVMDWGLAKVLPWRAGGVSPLLRHQQGADAPRSPGLETGAEPPDDRLTRAGSIMGTPAYMPPEQARAEPIDERGDVFSLGAILCEILTGAPPYAGSAGGNVLAHAQRGDLTEAFGRLDGCGADVGLARLAKDCLAPQPSARPRHAGIVADRVTTHLATVQERLRGVELERAAAQARAEEARAKAAVERRARRLTMTLAAVVLLTTLAGGAAAWGFQRDRDRRALQEMTRQAEENRKESNTVQAISLTLEQARAELDLDHHPAALVAARKAEGLLAAGGEALRPRVEEMLADLEMITRLEALRLETVEMLPNQSGFDPRPLSPRYRQAFDRYGIAVLTLEPDDAAEKIRRRAIRLPLVTALDHWAAFAPDADTRRRLLSIAQRADPEPDGVMAALRRAMMDEDSNAFRRTLFADERVKDLPPLVLFVLGSSLLATGNAAEAVRLLESACARRPQDFWLNYQLGVALSQLKPPQNAESVRYCTAAIALRPDVPSLWVNLGGVLAPQGRLPEAIAAFNKAIDLKPDYALAHYSLGIARMKGNDTDRGRKSLEEAIRLWPDFAPAHEALGNLLARQREPAEAEKHLREAIRLKPNYADAHNDLANVLAMRGKPDEAIASYRTALKFAPNDAKIWKNLGEIQGRQARWEEAVDSFEKALRLDPNYAEVHNDLGFVRLQQRRPNEAVAALRKAVALQPNSLKANANLANALRLGGQRKEAISVYRKVIELHPSPDTHYNLGNALLESGDLTGAKASCDEALKLKPDYAEARATLGLVLLSQGQFDEAKRNLTKGRDLLARSDPRRGQIQAAIGDCERLPRLIGKLPAILKGEAKPADNGERILLASYCMQVKHHYASAARLLADGFAADGKLADDPRVGLRFQAARAAVQSAAGQGEDAAALDDKSRLRWRKQALEWLRVDLTAWSKSVDRGPAAARAQARDALEGWRNEPLLAAVREPTQQVWLPEDERQAWRKLWAEVADLCKKVGP